MMVDEKVIIKGRLALQVALSVVYLEKYSVCGSLTLRLCPVPRTPSSASAVCLLVRVRKMQIS